MATDASRTIKSAHRVLEILEFFDQNHPSATVMELSRQLSYPQSSTSELLRCLTRLGYLHYSRSHRAYSPTARVALLGTWVKPALFRGGALLRCVDNLARITGQTVIVSSACNYVVQQAHVVHGSASEAVQVQVGQTESLLHSAQGRLLLSSYSCDQIRSATHRLNAEEPDMGRRVRVAEFLQELDRLHKTGWAISHQDPDTSTIAVLLAPVRAMDRMAISLIGCTRHMIANESELVAAVCAARDEIATECDALTPHEVASNVVPIYPEIKILSHRRHFA